MSVFRTVGELKTFLSNFPDDTNLISDTSNFERSKQSIGVYVSDDVIKFREEQRTAYDSFDYVSYGYSTLVRDSSGDIIGLYIGN